MTSLGEKIRYDWQGHQYWQKGDLVLLAISGGVDSMALLDVFMQLPEEIKPKLAVLHVHHHLREEAELDYLLVKNYCLEHELPFYVKHWQQTEHPPSNQEAAAREVRYAFFTEKMQELSAKVLVTAHHADDQMETILMRLTRGSTLAGYSGIQTSRPFADGLLVRPFLEVEKDTLYDYCATQKVAFREDLSNQADDYSRNRFRHHVIPFIKKENQQGARHFQDFSEDLTDALTVLQPIIIAVFQKHFQKKDELWELNIPAFLKEESAIQRLVMGYFLEEVWQNEGIGFRRSHIEAVLSMMRNKKPQASLTFSGGVAKKQYEALFFLTKPMHASQTNEKSDFQEELKQNQWLEQPFNGKIGLFSTYRKKTEKDVSYWLDEAGVEFPLSIRYWQAGDRIQLNKQAPFTKKLSRIFIDRKIPQEKRAQSQVVVDKAGTILWVPGYAASIWLTPMEENNHEKSSHNKKYLLVQVQKNN